MNIRSLFLILFLCLGYSSFAQNAIENANQLLGNWEKSYMDMKDGSKLLDEFTFQKTSSLISFGTKGIGAFTEGKTSSRFRYTMAGKTLVMGGLTYEIETLNSGELVFSEIDPNRKDYQLLRYHFIATKDSPEQFFIRKFINPNVRIKADGDTAYLFCSAVHPVFIADGRYGQVTESSFEGTYQNSYDFIERSFLFPPNKSGRFRINFTVTKTGKVDNIRIAESTDSLLNARLIEAVNSTQRKWIPAERNGKKVDVHFFYEFEYNAKLTADDEFEYVQYSGFEERADALKERKKYAKAIELYTKCILMRDNAIEPLYKRADCYFALNIVKNACSDWSYLSKLGQKRAEGLFIKNCLR